MIAQQSIQQILSRIDIVDIIGSFVKLKKRGANYLGLCPFHDERTPSFTVSPVKEIYKCFGCGRSGNAIGFLMEHEKYSYVEALRWLAAKYNVEIEESEISPELKLQQQVSESLFIINGFAQKFFTHALFNTEQGQDIGLSYLKERGFLEDTIVKFQLGYCPADGDAFSKEALASQFNSELLQKSGLVVWRDGKPMDNYRGRIIFPVHNQTGKIIGFGARVLKNNEHAPKYINTPENEIYLKSKILYGSYFARQAIDKQDECLLVEGYTDVISLAQAGIANVVASGGTSLTLDQLRLIKKYTNNLTILYDGDAAGVKAAQRGLDLALEEGLRVRVALIPDQDDPDGLVHRIGVSAFHTFLETNRKDIVLFQLTVALREAGQDPNKKASLVNQIAETISKINRTEDFTLQQDYIRRSAELLKIEEAGLHALVNKHTRDRVSRLPESRRSENASFTESETESTQSAFSDATDLLQPDELQERAIIKNLLEFGLKPWDDSKRVADFVLAEFTDEDIIDNKDLLQILELYKQWYEQGLEPTPKSFLYQPDPRVGKFIISLLDFPYELSANWKDHYEGKILSREELYKEEVLSTLNYLKLRKIKRLIAMNQKDLEQSTNPQEQSVFMHTHQHLKDMEKELLKQAGTVIVK